MDELQELRGGIDAIDARMVELFRRRMEVTARVGRYKLARGLPVLDTGREAQVLEKKAALAGEPVPEKPPLAQRCDTAVRQIELAARGGPAGRCDRPV